MEAQASFVMPSSRKRPKPVAIRRRPDSIYLTEITEFS
jgi:hypothetical protein